MNLEKEIADIKIIQTEILSYLQTDLRTGRKGLYEICERLEERVEALEDWQKEQKIKIGLVALVLTGLWTVGISLWKPVTAWFIKHFSAQ